jgi:hypothetical protein
MEFAQWLDAAATSARDVGAGALGMSDGKWAGPSSERLPGNLCGIYIPLVTDGLALQLGVLATRDVCATLARRLIAGGDEGEPLESEADVFDAVGEVTNLIAGNVKVLLADRVQIRVGVPLALSGRVIPIGASQSIHGNLELGDSSLWLLITGSRTR